MVNWASGNGQVNEMRRKNRPPLSDIVAITYDDNYFIYVTRSSGPTITGSKRATSLWIRPPKTGNDFWSGFSRSKLYALAKDNHIRSVWTASPGKSKARAFSN